MSQVFGQLAVTAARAALNSAIFVLQTAHVRRRVVAYLRLLRRTL